MDQGQMEKVVYIRMKKYRFLIAEVSPVCANPACAL